MPIGGLCAGQLYLGGDGKLWHWDIFNQHVGTGAEHYAAPLQPSSPVEQGFALKVTAAGHSTIRCWTEPALPRFLSGASIPSPPWTIAKTALPVSVRLEAFSPFIPLNVDDSSLPVTVLRYQVKNTGTERLECELAGWLENAVCLHSGPPKAVTQVVQPLEKVTFLEHSAADVPLDQSSRGQARSAVRGF